MPSSCIKIGTGSTTTITIIIPAIVATIQVVVILVMIRSIIPPACLDQINPPSLLWHQPRPFIHFRSLANLLQFNHLLHRQFIIFHSHTWIVIFPWTLSPIIRQSSFWWITSIHRQQTFPHSFLVVSLDVVSARHLRHQEVVLCQPSGMSVVKCQPSTCLPKLHHTQSGGKSSDWIKIETNLQEIGRTSNIYTYMAHKTILIRQIKYDTQ